MRSVAIQFIALALAVAGCATVPAWNDRSPEETRGWFLENIYGKRPPEAENPRVSFVPIGADRVMMDGSAVRRKVRITYEGPYGTNSFDVVAFLPAKRRPAPAFLLLCNRPASMNIDPERIVWKRAMDMNDRALREVSLHGNDKRNASREDSFLITVASEMMAILCLARDEEDFLSRVRKIIVAYRKDGSPVTVEDLRVSHAIMKLMREAFLPNLVQTLENNPCLIHGGPFANIAHGCNSIIATNLAMSLAPITVTEAGFGADLGAEKFLDIKCREAGIAPDAVVMVATIRALKMHGGQAFEDLATPSVEALSKGVASVTQASQRTKASSL